MRRRNLLKSCLAAPFFGLLKGKKPKDKLECSGKNGTLCPRCKFNEDRISTNKGLSANDICNEALKKINEPEICCKESDFTTESIRDLEMELEKYAIKPYKGFVGMGSQGFFEIKSEEEFESLINGRRA